ncbi:MAG TPA: hypothetical protein VIJ22_06650 [Polyangiaceae bacterium]
MMSPVQPRPCGGYYRRVAEVRDLMFTPGVPEAYKAPARVYAAALTNACRRLPAWPGARLDQLLDEAVTHARTAMAKDLRAARDGAGLTRLDLARRLRRTTLYVGRVERGEAAVDLEYRERVLRACGRRRRVGVDRKRTGGMP